MLHPALRDNGGRAPDDALAEAVSLAEALDLQIIDAAVVSLRGVRAGTLFGRGKIEELRAAVEGARADLVVIDGTVTPVQQRNLERAWKVKVLDRTGLILEIFGERARTREGVLQVELAHLNYQKSRLVRSWTHLERQRGGFGFLGGPGETQIEADRRALDERIGRLKRELSKVARTRGLHRSARARVPYPVVALVGYTNAGKSTLFNRLTSAGVIAEDMLFATLDPTMRAITLPAGRRIIVSDTVGFISDLPTQLVAAFRSTLEEVRSADLILHVRDISHPEAGRQAASVAETLGDLGIDTESDGRLREVWNKIDRLVPTDSGSIEQMAARTDRVSAISALTGQGVDTLLSEIESALSEPLWQENLHLDFGDGRARAWLFERRLVVGEVESETGYDLAVRWTERDRARFQAFHAEGAASA